MYSLSCHHYTWPLHRLGRQLQLSAYWVWQHKHWLSAAIVSSHHHGNANRHTCTQTLTYLSLLLTLYFILPPTLSFQVNTLPLCVRLTTEMLSVAEGPLLVYTVLSLCQSHPNASDACRACPLCAYACVVCAYVVLCLCMRMCV